MFDVFYIVFLEKWLGDDTQTAASLLTIGDWIGVIVCPLIGLLVGQVGMRAQMTMCAAAMISLSHLFYRTTLNPFVGMIVIGLASCTYFISVWGCLPLVVPPAKIGTAYGILMAILNLSAFIFPFVSTELQKLGDSTDYSRLLLFSISMALLAMLLSLTLYMYDSYYFGGELEQGVSEDMLNADLTRGDTKAYLLHSPTKPRLVLLDDNNNTTRRRISKRVSPASKFSVY